MGQAKVILSYHPASTTSELIRGSALPETDWELEGVLLQQKQWIMSGKYNKCPAFVCFPDLFPEYDPYIFTESIVL